MAEVPKPTIDGFAKQRSKALLRQRMFGIRAEEIKIGRLIVLDTIGRGAMGTVYAARDPDLDRKVAVKLIRPELARDTVARERLLREARAMARLSHPNVVSVYDVGTVDDTVWLSMELVDGTTLRDWLSKEQRSWREVVEVFLQAGRGLEAAHAAGLIHRDFKPENVLVCTSGRVQVADFGVAGLTEADEQTLQGSGDESQQAPGSRSVALTRTGGILGTPRYMAPEQLSGAATDPRSDEFGFCVALYESLYGETPFAGASIAELAEAVSGGELRKPSDERGVPPRIRRVLECGLRPRPEERYPSMTELLAELGRDPGKRRRTAAIAVGCVAAIAIGIYGMIGGSGGASSAAMECTGAAEQLENVWNDELRARLTRAFGDSGAPAASMIAQRTTGALDRYAAGWMDAHAAACRAGVRAEHSQEMLDKRMACLAERRGRLDALVEVLVEADEATVLEAVQSVDRLPGVSSCGDVDMLSKEVGPPVDPTVRTRVDSLRAELAEAHALLSSGNYKAGLTVARRIHAELDDLRYPPFIAETDLLMGRLENETGDYHSSARRLEAAYFRALAAKDDKTAGEASARLVRVVGFQLEQHERALEWAKHAQAVIARYRADASLEALLLENRGGVLQRAGKADRAEVEYRRALELRESFENVDPLGTVSSLHGLAQVLDKLGRFDDALQVRQRAQRISDEHLGPDHPRSIIMLSGVASTLAQRGDFERAEPIMRTVLERLRKTFGEQHPNVAHVANNLGLIYESQEKLDQALAMLRQGLAIRRAKLGAEHLSVGESLDNIGLVLRQQGRLREALSAHRQALAIKSKHVPSHHPTMAGVKNNIALVFSAMGRLTQAREMLEQVKDDAIKVNGPNHPDVAYALHARAELDLRQEKFDEARRAYARALAIFTKAHGADNPITAHAHAGMGGALRGLRQLDRARHHTEHAMAIWIEAHGPDHPLVIQQLTELGNLYRAWGKVDRAIEYHEKALAIRTKKQGPDHPDLAYSLASLGNAYLEKRQPRKAIEVLRRAIALHGARQVPPRKEIAAAQRSLALALRRTGKSAEAGAAMRRARANEQAARATARQTK